MFQINDTVSYGTQGVCTVTGIEKMNLAGKTEEYYVLKPVYQTHSTIYVPLSNDALVEKMRRVLSREETEELIRTIPDEETIWIDDELERKEKYNQIINSGDRKKIAGLIKTLYFEQTRRQSSGKRLRQSDEQLFKRAENLLYSELALVLDIKPDQVVPFLNEQIGIDDLYKKNKK